MVTARAVFRLFLLFLLSCAVVGFQTILLPFYRGPASYIVPRLWQRGTCRIFDIRIITVGTPETKRQTLYVSNHLSYLDIPVAGSFVLGSFVARGDVEKWPAIGYMGKMQQTAYISRSRKDAGKEKGTLESLLAGGRNLIIFAEGTSTDGTKVLPFKSSFFTLALKNPTGKPLLVQPMTISLLEADRRPATDAATRDLYAWHGDMTLPPHIWRVARMNGAVLKVRFHPPRDAALYSERKTLCQDCYNDVAGGLETPLARAA